MVHVPTLAELKQFVRCVLCARADLDLVTPLLEVMLLRRKRPCGIEYTLLASHSVRLSAIWDAGCDRVLFYDQNLERFQVTPVQGPGIDEIADHTFAEVQVESVWHGK